jgi:small subunit ribosomal protein S7
MPRRREVEKREILPDPKFNSTELSKFINIIMERGKKAVAEKIVYNALDIINNKSKKDGIEVFRQAMDAIKPLVELKSRRVGGANYQIPVEVSPVRQVALAMRWIRDAARKRSEKSMDIRLANELLDAIDGRGAALKRREETHKMAEANKAYAHFRY